ncbi:MAG: PAS domain S-box protein, partial [Proteobacteria bacterium]|nr:PAS domain S-box protein [Pseudomonadota bacterium]
QERDKVVDRFRRRMAGENVPSAYETRLVRKDGRMIDVEINAGIINYQGERANLTILRDITERKRAEQERLAHVRMLEALDQINRAIVGTDDLDQMMSDVLEATRSIFKADRAWLCFPCDPDAPTWRVPMDQTVPEYPGAIQLGVEVPLDPGAAEEFRMFLESDGPLSFGPSTEHPARKDFSEELRFKSQLAMAIYPKVGPPWLFGLHQCSHPRVWTEEEERILEQIGRRMADALTSLLTRRDLAESEERYRDLIEKEKDIIYALDSTGNITFASPAVTEVLGYLPEELIGRDFMELVPEDWQQRTEADFLSLLATGEITAETVLLDKDLQPRAVEYSSTVVKDGDQLTGTRGIVRDISQRKRAEEALEREHEQLLSIFESMDQIVYVTDPETYEVLFVNEVVRRSFEKDPVGGLCYREFQGLDAPCDFCTNPIITANKNEPYQWEYHNPTLGRDYALTDRIIKWPDDRDVRLEIAIDITERKRAEGALRESEEKFRELVERAQDGIVIIHQHLVEYVNLAYTRLTGYESEELVGQTYAILIDPRERDKVEDRYRRRMAGEDVPPIYETRLVRKDGRVIDVEFNAGTINYKGEPANLTIVRDIAERKRVEQERLAHVRMLEALDRINRAIQGTDDLDQMMADVLEATLAIFETDRAWLQFPCDPDAPTWRVPMLRTVLDHSNALIPGIEIPTEPEFAEVMRRFLGSEGPIGLTPEPDQLWMKEFAEKYGFQSSLAMAIHPKVGPPWLFGLHQCSHPRVWTAEEERILEQIGRRMADALTSLLTRRDLRESEEKFRNLFEGSGHSIIVLDRDGVVMMANPIAARNLERTPEQCRGRSIRELLPEGNAYPLERIAEVFDTGQR